MKKLLGILVLFFILNGCDDGNVVYQNINFDNVNAASCGDFIYKINDNQVLILNIPASHNAFPNISTDPNSPRTFSIGGDIKVYYRAYNGTATLDNICTLPTPVTPIVTEQWTASSGIIEISTTPIKSVPDATTNRTKITGYNHKIVFKGITFQKPSGPQLYDVYTFGNYQINATLPFAFANTLKKCTSSNIVYNQVGSEALTINIDPALINNTINPANAPKTGNITTTTNIVTYGLYAGLLPLGYFCNATTPPTPSILEKWSASVGTITSGSVQVYTTTNGPGVYLHSIHLVGVNFYKDYSNFYLGDDYYLGDLIMN